MTDPSVSARDRATEAITDATALSGYHAEIAVDALLARPDVLTALAGIQPSPDLPTARQVAVPTRKRRITPAQIEKAIGVLGEVSCYADVDGKDRDEISHVIEILDRLFEAGGVGR